MAEHTEVLATDLNFPNLLIYRTYADGVHDGYRVVSADGYVMYDSAENSTELDPDTMEEVPVTYYYTVAHLSMRTNFDNFTWVAVLRSEVDENYIFGGGNNHEVM